MKLMTSFALFHFGVLVVDEHIEKSFASVSCRYEIAVSHLARSVAWRFATVQADALKRECGERNEIVDERSS